MSSPSAFLGGGPINSFQCAGLPTLRDVMRFYIQFWNMRGSETNRSRRVANALLNFYNDRSLPTMTDRGIMNKIEKCVSDLKTILKNNSKRKNLRISMCEQRFSQKLDEVFRIEVAVCNSEVESIETSDQMEIDTDNTNGILKLATM